MRTRLVPLLDAVPPVADTLLHPSVPPTRLLPLSVSEIG